MTTDFKVPLSDETKAMLKRSAADDARSMRKQAQKFIADALTAKAAETAGTGGPKVMEKLT